MGRSPAIFLLIASVACATGTKRHAPTDSGAGTDTSASDSADTSTDSGTCLLGDQCDPIAITALPVTEHGDTTAGFANDASRYACAPSTDESGPDVWYALDVPAPGVLSIQVADGADVDVDVHLLDAADPDHCVARDDRDTAYYVTAGTWYVVADTWVNGAGQAQAGAYDLSLDFQAMAPDTPCALQQQDLRMYWSDCAPGIDCYRAPDSGGAQRAWLRTPAWGPVVKEAHLVTTDDVSHLAGGWPSSFTDGIDGHYGRSQATSSYTMTRDQPWAPNSEGNSHYGEGATGAPLPPEDEAWYVNMYWRDRPAPGTRVLVYDPANHRAVVASGGYETGPGSNTAIGGAVEEIHDWLGTSHRDRLVMGFLVDQSLPLGPIDCSSR